MSSFLAVAAACWGVLMSLAPVLQIRAMRRAGSSDGVSIGYLLVLAVGFGLWFLYGVSIGNAALVITNTVAFVVGTTTAITAWRLRPAKASPAEPARVGVTVG